MSESMPLIVVRRATEADLPRIVTMMDDFATGHPSKGRARTCVRLADAFFGPEPVARIYVAEKADLAGAPPRALVRGLPDPDLNRQPARPRG